MHMSTRELSTIRKGIQKRLSSPNSLFWKFDGQDRGGIPHKIFLDLDYRGKSVVIEWRSLFETQFGVSLITEETGYGEGADFVANNPEEAVAKAVEFLEATRASISQ